MNKLFEDFAKAHTIRNGYLLAQTISPVAPANEPHRLRRIWQSTNAQGAKGDIKHLIKSKKLNGTSLNRDEVNGWADVYVAYWNAIGEILAGESGKVSTEHLLLVTWLSSKVTHHGKPNSALGPKYMKRGKT